MYINFQQIGLVDQSKPCTQMYLQIIASCINLQLPTVVLKKKLIILDMHHHITYMYLNFQEIGLVYQSKLCTQLCLQIIVSLHKFATTNSNSPKN